MSLTEQLKSILGDDCVKVNEPMSKHTSFKVGGAAEIFAEPKDAETLQRLLRTDRSLYIGKRKQYACKRQGLQGSHHFHA